MPDLTARIARLRVPLGFACGTLAVWLARPTWRSLVLGLPLAVAGEGLRVWAAGHLEKNREVTRSGPYRWTGHPLYAGSALMVAGFAVAAASVSVAALAVVYVVAAIGAAIRTEERWLTAQFGEEYAGYRRGTAVGGQRRFSLARAWRNREYRAVAGLVLVLLVLVLKAGVR